MGESPYDFALRLEDPESRTQSYDEFNLTAMNNTLDFTVFVNNTGEAWDNFSANVSLKKEPENWTVLITAMNGSLLNQTEREKLADDGIRLEPDQALTLTIELTRESVNATSPCEVTLKVTSRKGETKQTLGLTAIVLEVPAEEEEGGRS